MSRSNHNTVTEELCLQLKADTFHSYFRSSNESCITLVVFLHNLFFSLSHSFSCYFCSCSLTITALVSYNNAHFVTDFLLLCTIDVFFSLFLLSFYLFVWISNISTNYYFSFDIWRCECTLLCSPQEMWTCKCMFMSYTCLLCLGLFFFMLSITFCVCSFYGKISQASQATLFQISKFSMNFLVLFIVSEKIATWSQLGEGKYCADLEF